jgi:hypothetical protein
MCWNPAVSLSTFILACAGTAIGQINGLHDWRWSVFYLTVASMQLLEYYIWQTLLRPGQAGGASLSLNLKLSAIGLALIFLQPVAAGWLIPDARRRAAFFAAYSLFVLVYALVAWPIEFRTSVAANGHLRWHWLTPPLALVVAWTLFVLAALYLSGMPRRAFAAIALFVLALTGTSYYYYRAHAGTWGSVYCSFVNVMFAVILVKAFTKQYCARVR